MPRKKLINFALLGFGKLGKGFYDVWMKKREAIKEETGFDLKLKKILVKNTNFKRLAQVDQSLFTTDLNEIISDSSIIIAIDAIGGIEPTFSIIRKLISGKKNIVSANRALLAAKMHQLADQANENNIYIQVEPSLGGGVPIITAIQRDLVANKIKSMIGILSGTSNYILSEMSRKTASLKEILKIPEIQKMGETLSIIDYEGSDAAQKVAILAASSFGIDVNYLHVHAEGISDISTLDIRSAREFGYEFKLLAILKDHPESFEIRVHPTLVPLDHPLANIRGEYNAFYIDTDLIGTYMLYGKGVGIEPTSSLILRDVVAIAKHLYHSPQKYTYQLNWNEKPVLAMDDIQGGYYIRFPCQDKPGVIGEITMVLGKYNINIESAHAEVDKTDSTEIGYVHILLDHAVEKDIRKAITEISELNIIRDRIKYFRILQA